MRETAVIWHAWHAPSHATAAPSQPTRAQGTRSASKFSAAFRLRARYCVSSYSILKGAYLPGPHFWCHAPYFTDIFVTICIGSLSTVLLSVQVWYLYTEHYGDTRVQAAAPVRAGGRNVALSCGRGMAPLAVGALGIPFGLADWAQHGEGADPALQGVV